MTTVTKKDKLLNSFRTGKRLTVDQIASRFGYASRNSVYATISQLRDAGHFITGTQAKNGMTAYGL